MDDSHHSLLLKLSGAHFVNPGQYHLQLTLFTDTEDCKGVTVQIAVGTEYGEAVESMTAVIGVKQKVPSADSDSAEEVSPMLVMAELDSSQVMFIMPPGFIAKSLEGQLLLIVVVLDDSTDRHVMGKGVCPVVSPDAGLMYNSSLDNLLYQKEEVMILARLLVNENVPLAIGRIAVTSTLTRVSEDELKQVEKHIIAKSSTQEKRTAEYDVGVPKEVAKPESPELPVGVHIDDAPEAAMVTSATVEAATVEGPSVVPDFHAELQQKAVEVKPVAAPFQVKPSLPEQKPTRPDHLVTKERTFSPSPIPLSWEPPCPELPDVKIEASPLPAEDVVMRSAASDSSEVPAEGTEEIVILLYGASNLPRLANGKSSKPFLLVRLVNSLRKNSVQGSSAATHATLTPTCFPTWFEAAVIVASRSKVDNEELEFCIMDENSKQLLVTYKFPVVLLSPFYHYHLNLVSPVKNLQGGVHLYVSILRKLPQLSSLPDVSPNYEGLKVTIQGVQEKLKLPVGPIIAVAKIVTDVDSYKRTVGRDLRGGPGVPMTMITFPSPHPVWFQATHSETCRHAQVCLPGQPLDQPQWDHTFLFSHPKDTAIFFTPGSALLIEYYHARVISSALWKLDDLVGFSCLLLNTHSYQQLSGCLAGVGLRVQGLLVQGGKLLTLSDTAPTVDVTISLLTDQGPAGSLSKSEYMPRFNFSSPSPDVPAFIRLTESLNDVTSGGLQPTTSTTSLIEWMSGTARPRTRPEDLDMAQYFSQHQPYTDGDLPSHEAIEKLLPEYQYIIMDKEGRPSPSTSRHLPHPRPEDVERVSMSLLDYQQQELEKYRQAVQTMGQDVLALRQQVRDLDTSNSQLRRELAGYTDTTRLLRDAQDLDGLGKPQLAERYVSLKQSMTRHVAELSDYKERVLQLQNELIKKNDREKDYMRLSDAHSTQQDVLQRLQNRAAKVRKLEDAIRKQEKVIEKMEKIINSRSKGPSREKIGDSEVVNQALMEENRRLRSELQDAKDMAGMSGRESDQQERERLDLYQRLGRSDERILSLEKQLANNARTWAREKSDLTLRLKEAEAGLSRTSLSNDGGLGFDASPRTRSRRQVEPLRDPRRHTQHPLLPQPKNKPHIGYDPRYYDPMIHQ